MARRLSLSLCCFVFAGAVAPGSANAAELGEARVASHIGQPLVADIELQDAAAPLQVRLANADVYRGAGQAMPAMLSGLNLSVVARDGRQVLHVSSQAPVQAEYLHLYLELVEGEQRSVRLVTLWLTPNPRPAPPPVAARPLAPLPPPQLMPAAPKPEPQPVAKPMPRAMLAEDAVTKVAPAPVPKPAPKAALAPQPLPGPAPQVQAQPPAHKAGPMPKPAPHTTVHGHAAAAPGLPAAPSASCARPEALPQPKACVALDYKSAQLKAQIGQLEDKVRVLQVALGAAPAAVMPAAGPSDPSGPAEPEDGYAAGEDLPWLWLAIGGGALLAAGGGAAMIARRRRAKKAAKAKQLRAVLPLQQGFMAGVKKRLIPGSRAATPKPAAEPKSAPDPVPAGSAAD
jgi:hypothetical protein